MATYTSYLNLEKPTTSETFNLLKMNQNWDKIDAGVSALNSKFLNHTVETVMSVYVQPTFENGVATVDLTTYLSNRGFTRLEQIVGAQFSTGSVQATVIRGTDVVSGNTIKIVTTSSSFNGEYGVIVMFRGNY